MAIELGKPSGGGPTNRGDLRGRVASLPAERRELLVLMLQRKGVDLSRELILPCPRSGNPMPPSISQTRLWFLDQVHPGNPAYHMVTAIRLTGPLDLPALREAFNRILERHEALRTGFREVDGEPVQVIVTGVRLALPLLDLSALPASVATAVVAERQEEVATIPFDLSRPPLARCRLLKLGRDEHMLLFVVHHIVFDGWSIAVMLQEIEAFYNASVKAEPIFLTPLPLQFADFAQWQRARLMGTDLAAQANYWREKLSGPLPSLELPGAHPRPIIVGCRGGWIPVDLPHGLAAQSEAIARKEGTTLFAFLLGAFKVLLHRHTGAEDLPVGVPVSGRDRKECERLIGFFVNTLVCRTQLRSDLTFREALAKVHQTLLEAFDNQELPFDQVVSLVQPERHPGSTPLIQMAMALHENPPMPRLHGLTLAKVEVPWRWSRFELTLMLERAGNDLQGGIEYSAERYDAETIAGLASGFGRLLPTVCRDPSIGIRDIPLSLGENDPLLGAATELGRQPIPGDMASPWVDLHEPTAGAVQPAEEAMREAICAIWKGVLQVAQVGLDDNFFDLGGHSLRLGKVKDELKNQLGREVPMVQLFAHPTVASLARYLAGWEEKTSLRLDGASRAAQRRLALQQLPGQHSLRKAIFNRRA